MSDGPVTLSRVAREAGVSLATASRAINGSATRTVRPELRDRVLAAAQRLGYVPDPSAQAMARGRTAALGLVVHDIADPYFSAIASGVTRAAENQGLIVTLASTELRPDRERAFVELVRRQRGRAVILAGSRTVPDGAAPTVEDAESSGETSGPGATVASSEDLASALTAFRESGGGVATIGQAIGSLPVVEIDNAGGAAALARELHGLGYRRFGVLSGPPGLRTAADRTAGFRDALASLGSTVRDDDVVAGEFTRDGGYAAMAHLIARSGRGEADGTLLDPGSDKAGRGGARAADAGGRTVGGEPAMRDQPATGGGPGLPELVFAVNDVMAVGAMAAVRDAGLGVPDDVAVAGFDDIPTLRDVTPALTTVHIALERIGEAATHLALGEPTGLEPTPATGTEASEAGTGATETGTGATEAGTAATEGLEATAPGSITVRGEVILRASTPGP
ncbi:LacI family DNA-binding transcriptional regulator [Myceligenerans salitolerans]|uniref:LacI family DNA-binding transcriptional regulator n=1 Tax=Myceligenerans salitolerans TaxID=1230528 RepID=A0ABS3I8H8_9MICO|nr:LacI family DNA-binding transcriptional regulator [Myceligenerans salitolerans]MBO0609325.1 LacI family DNA-binding transcriptional regulator [Myceligenerans salitolerans]